MKKMIVALMMAIAMMGTGLLLPANVSAVKFGDKGDNCTKNFLGLRPWYYGLEKGENCTVASPTEDKMSAFVWIIVLNVLGDLLGAIGYLSIGFVIYGGVLFIKAEGEPGKVAKGKKTLTAAIIGMAISLLASVIVNTIVAVLSGVIS